MLIALTITSRSLPQQHGLHRIENDEDIEGEREVLDVEQVVLQFLQGVFDAGSVGVPHLRPTRETWPNDVALAIEGDLQGQLVDELRALRPWPDQAHVSLEHVPQLRQLVESAAPQEAANRRHADIALLRGPDGTRGLLGISPHRPELVEREDTAVLADASLVVQHRARRRHADEQRNQQHDRRRDDETDSGGRDIDEAFRRGQHVALLETRREDQPARTQILDRDFSRVLLVHGGEVIKRHPVELHLEQFLHRQHPASLRQADDDAVDIARTNNRRNIFNRADHAGIDDGHSDPEWVHVYEPDNLDAQLVSQLEHLTGECYRRRIGANQQQPLVRRQTTARPFEGDAPADHEGDDEQGGNQEHSASDDQRGKPEID